MGCCFSTPKLRSNAPKLNATHEAECRVSPPHVEEESVKEVLSETPISKPHQVPILKLETKTQMAIMQHKKVPMDNAFLLEEVSEDVSVISGTCSISENFSTTTTATVPEMREDEATSKRSTREGNRNRNRSNSDAYRKRSHTVDGNRIRGRERRPKSPARVQEISPEKKVQVGSRSIRRRDSDQFRSDSGRRSRSPSCVRIVGTSAGAGRSHLRPPGGASRRLPPPPAKGAEKENGENEKVVRERNDGVSMEESLENPHVSLECFIFL